MLQFLNQKLTSESQSIRCMRQLLVNTSQIATRDKLIGNIKNYVQLVVTVSEQILQLSKADNTHYALFPDSMRLDALAHTLSISLLCPECPAKQPSAAPQAHTVQVFAGENLLEDTEREVFQKRLGIIQLKCSGGLHNLSIDWKRLVVIPATQGIFCQVCGNGEVNIRKNESQESDEMDDCYMCSANAWI